MQIAISLTDARPGLAVENRIAGARAGDPYT
jgi:hypothetical protein